MTKLLMISSALFLAVCGVAASFAPGELLAVADMSATTTLLSGVQICGALFLGFAMLNWMAKDSLVGGIYNRPLVLGNALHFFAGAMSLLRAFRAHQHLLLTIVTGLYVVFACAFFVVLFRSPIKRPDAA